MGIKKYGLKLFRAISAVLPARKNLWLFGAWDGKLYSDNTRYLYEYIARSQPEINAVWVTQNDEVLAKLHREGFKCVKKSSFLGILYCIFAEAAFVTNSFGDISNIINPEKTLAINLWHGLGVKDLKYKDANGNTVQFDYMKEYLFFGTSPYYTETLSRQFKLPESKFYITGYPRNDVFVSKKKNEAMEMITNRFPGKRFVIYMPTHRNFGKDENSMTSVDQLKKLDQLLDDNNMIMVYKPHQHEIKVLSAYGDIFKNIILAQDTSVWGDPYSYLYYFDGLISDYSSVTSDFICSGKPAVLFPYDIEHYKTEDGGILPVFWETPAGPLCMTWDEVISTMAGLLENDTWKEKREECRKKYHVFNDGRNCERAFETAEKLLRERKQK